MLPSSVSFRLGSAVEKKDGVQGRDDRLLDTDQQYEVARMGIVRIKQQRCCISATLRVGMMGAIPLGAKIMFSYPHLVNYADKLMIELHHFHQSLDRHSLVDRVHTSTPWIMTSSPWGHAIYLRRQIPVISCISVPWYSISLLPCHTEAAQAHH